MMEAFHLWLKHNNAEAFAAAQAKKSTDELQRVRLVRDEASRQLARYLLDHGHLGFVSIEGVVFHLLNDPPHVVRVSITDLTVS